ncbi:hypothetical protein Tco_0224077 [Tanacetum coccineum]
MQTRRHMATDPEMCMFATHRESLVDRLQVWEHRLTNLLARTINLHQLLRIEAIRIFVAYLHTSLIQFIRWTVENGISKWSIEVRGGLCCTNQTDSYVSGSSRHSLPSKEISIRIETAPRAWYDELFKIPDSKDLSGEPVDQTDYHSKIGSLMYLTSSRPDIVQAMPIMPVALILAKALLGDKLVSWMSKKQDCTAMSSAEAEYVALSASCAQLLSVSHSNIMQPRAALPYQAHSYSPFPKKGFSISPTYGMRCLTPAELEVLTQRISFITSSK